MTPNEDFFFIFKIMTELVIVKNENLVVSSRTFADGFEVEHESLMRLIKTHQEVIESNFGRVGFEIGTVQNSVGAINETKTAYFTENQALFIGTLLRNSEKAVAFKALMVFEFAKLKAQAPKELSKREILLLALESEERALLAEAKVLEQQPKVEAFDRVIDNSTTYTLDTVSDILNYGRNKLSDKLKEIGWAMKDSSKGTSSTRKVEEVGYARTFFETIQKGKQELKVKKIVITKKGLDYLVNNYTKIFA